MTMKYIVYVRNIPWTVSQCEFENYFLQFGIVRRAILNFYPTGISTGTGILECNNKMAMSAILSIDHVLEDEKLLLNDKSSGNEKH